MHKKPLKLTPKQALAKARNLCAKQERSHKEIRDKLYTWGLFSTEVENIIATLITEGFLNELRFAQLYAGGKFRIKKWGKAKIINGLKQHQISTYCIQKAMHEIEDNTYQKTITDLIHKKLKNAKHYSTFEAKGKIAKYLIQKGFEAQLVWEIINEEITSKY